MRIGIEAQRIYRSHKHGMDFVALEMIRKLQQIDKENDYFIFVNEGPDSACLQESSNFKIIVFGGPYPVWEQYSLPRKAEEFALDLLHCTSNTAPVRCPVPLVVTIHDIIYFETHPLRSKDYSAYQKFGNLYRRWVVKRILKTAEKIITVSNFEKQRFLSFLSLQDEEVEVVYNGVGEHFHPIEDKELLEKVKEKYKLPEKYLLFLGNTDPKKNTANTVKAFARYCKKYGREHKLLIGDLDPEVIHRFLAQDNSEEFFDNIQFSGYINNNELPAILNLADIFLYPSKRESFGIPVLEGMASGVPVITSNTSSMPEVGADAAVYVDPENVEEIAEAINTLLTDENLRNKNIKAGINRAAEFSWEHTAGQVLEIYKSILGK